MSCSLCPKRALQLYVSLAGDISPCTAVPFTRLHLYHFLSTTLQNQQVAFSQYPKGLQIKTLGVKKDSLQLGDALTFLQDCTQLFQVTGLKMTVCQSRGKKESTVQVCRIANKTVNFTPQKTRE